MHSGIVRRLRARAGRCWRFVVEDVWDVELSSVSLKRGLLVRMVRVVYLVIRGFREDECPLHASALTFSTLMAVVPVLVLSLSLVRVFGGDELAKQKLQGLVSEWTATFEGVPLFADGEDAEPDGMDAQGDAAEPHGLAVEIDRLVERGFEKVENISFAALGGVGLIVLLWMVIDVLGRVEASFNRVWGISSGRSVWRRFTDYLSVVLILPFLVVMASSLPIVDLLSRFLDESTASGLRSALGSGLLRPVAVTGLTALSFTFLILFMPNTRVRVAPGLAGGAVAAVLFIAWLRLCAALQVGVANYSRIYGSFAVVPILLAWLYVSWNIVLFGAEVAFAVQNCATYLLERGANRASAQARILLALSVLRDAGLAMVGKGEPVDLERYARRKRISVRFLNEVVRELATLGFLGELAEAKGTYALLRAPGTLAVRDVVASILKAGVGPVALGLGGPNASLEDVFADMEQGMANGLRQASIADLFPGEGGAAVAG